MEKSEKQLVIRESRGDRAAPDGTCDETLAEQEEERKLYRVMTRGRDVCVYVIACDAIAAITEVEKCIGQSSHYSVTEVDRDVFFAGC